MTPEQQAAYERFKAAMDEFFGYIVETAAKEPAPVRPSTAARVPARVQPSSPLPRPLTPPAKSGTMLSDKIRKENLPAAKAVALKILKVIGESSNLVQGVTGQLAIERIPYDVTLVQQAIEAARHEL